MGFRYVCDRPQAIKDAKNNAQRVRDRDREREKAFTWLGYAHVQKRKLQVAQEEVHACSSPSAEREHAVES